MIDDGYSSAVRWFRTSSIAGNISPSVGVGRNCSSDPVDGREEPAELGGVPVRHHVWPGALLWLHEPSRFTEHVWPSRCAKCSPLPLASL